MEKRADHMVTERVDKEKKVPKDVRQTAASKRFGVYKSESEKAVRRAAVERDGVMEELKKIFTDYKMPTLESYAGGVTGHHHEPDGEAFYEKIRHFTALKDRTAEEVERFSILLLELQGEEDFGRKAGMMLSAMINMGNDRHYRIHTIALDRPLYHLGFKNRKAITVFGDAGYSAGHKMEAGVIAVTGCAKGHAGNSMSGGTIVIEKDGGDTVGAGMNGGEVIVQGDARQGVGVAMTGGCIRIRGSVIRMGGSEVLGLGMRGGEIHVDGDCEIANAGLIGAGKIYHRGKLIVDK
jgi:hypothetical protein